MLYLRLLGGEIMKKILKWGLIIFAGIIALGMIGKYGGSTSQSPSPAATEAPTQPQKAAAPTNPPTITDRLCIPTSEV